MTAIAFPTKTRISRSAADLRAGERLAAMDGNEVGPSDVFRVLNAKKLKAVLVGGHAVNARTGDPRSTIDVDLVAQYPAKVARELVAAFPTLTMKDHPVVTRLMEGKTERIDIIKPQYAAVFAEALKSAETVVVNRVPIRLPTVEVMLALKFSSLISLTRKYEDQLVDARDFVLIAKQLKTIDERRIRVVGEQVYPGGGDELLKMINDARAGRRLSV